MRSTPHAHRIATLAIALIALLATTALAGDWAQFQGPGRNGVSTETGIARVWPEGGPKVLWTLDLGPGYGGAAVTKGKVYLLDRITGKKDMFRCLDLNSGKELWSFAYDAKGRVQNRGSRSTPAIDGNYIYTCGSFGDLYCFERESPDDLMLKISGHVQFTDPDAGWDVGLAALLRDDSVFEWTGTCPYSTSGYIRVELIQ